MNMEHPPQTPSRLEMLLEIIQRSPETVDELEASMLFLDTDFADFQRMMMNLGKDGRTFSLVFMMDDLGKTDVEKKARLRQLKAIREDSKLSDIVTHITVKGAPGEESVEPNVFSSDVQFEAIIE